MFNSHIILPFISIFSWLKGREKVTTTKITTSKTKKYIKKFANHHYIKSPFLVDHYYDITTASLHQKWLFS